MSGVEVLAVVSCVAAIVSAYSDGTGLIKRIKARRAEKRRALETQELEASLTLGPVTVQGQYNHDYHRFGERYAQGDYIAREQLKDIIINLQMALLTNLRVSLTNDVELDFAALQIASDNSRVDSVRALCQLHQRLSQAIPLRISPLSQPPPDPRISHVSTVSSRDSFSASVSTMSTSTPAYSHLDRSESPSLLTQETRQASGGPASASPPSRHRSLFGKINLGRSSQRHGNGSPFPTTSVTESEEKDRAHGNGPRNNKSSTVNTNKQKRADDIPGQFSLRGGYYSPDEVNPWTQEDPTTSTTHAHEDGSIETEAMNIFDPDGWASEKTIESNPNHIRPPSSLFSERSSHSSTSGTFLTATATGMGTGTAANMMRLYLPSEENNFAGFCKGAWKLQLGLKKAFSIRMRPAGMYNEIPFWRCSKCCYEGPVRGSSARSSWKYDDQVHIHQATGIRYRWVFLAKSHIHCKKVITDGSAAPFGCLFCCVEQRTAAPVFGNLPSFMEHLLQHRQMSAGSEALLGRTQCIVGRMADNCEDFDLNLP